MKLFNASVGLKVIFGVLLVTYTVSAYQHSLPSLFSITDTTPTTQTIEGTYPTSEECSSHANTSQICRKISTADGIRWKVTPNQPIPPQPLPIKITKATTSCGPNDSCPEIHSATMSDSCAPWDGPAIAITVLYNGGTLWAQIYAQGLSLFKANKPVIVPHEGLDSVSGTGLAIFCKKTSDCEAYRDDEVMISVSNAIVDATNTVQGIITVKGVQIPIEVTWDSTPTRCG